MNIENLNAYLSDLTKMKEEVENTSQNSRSYSLDDYIDFFRSKIGFFDHGVRDKFTVPFYDASLHIDDLSDSKYSFSVKKTKLVSTINQYIKGMQRGLKLHEKELGTTRKNW